MTKAAFSTLLLLALAGATYGEDPSMEALRAQYRRQVLAKVGTHYAELNSQALLDAAGDVAKAVFSPRADLLKREAEREFRALPRYDDAKLSGFATRDPLSKEKIEASIAFLAGPHLHTPAMLPNGWSPKETARRAKQAVVSRLVSAQVIGQRILLEKFIPDEYYRLNDDYANPTVVVRSLDELFLVTLKLKKSGIYTPVKLEWLAGKVPTEPLPHTSSASPRQPRTVTRQEMLAKAELVTKQDATVRGLQSEATETPSGLVWAWGSVPMSKGPDAKGRIREIQDRELIREIQDVVAVAAGSTTSYALTKSGNVWAWGHGPSRLGAGTEEDQPTQVRVKGLSEVTAISASFHHCLALKRDGTVWAWGRNARGQLGDGTRESRNVPVQVKGIKDVVAVSAGRSHSCVLRNDGTVWAWGDNHYGQCTESKDVLHCPTPVRMAGLSDVIAVSNGYTHNLALRKDGTVWQWGYLSRKPFRVPQLDRVKAIAAGAWFALALKEDGTLWTWGDLEQAWWPKGVTNVVPSYRREESGEFTLRDIPQQCVLHQVKDWRDVTLIAAECRAVVARKDGSVYEWGRKCWLRSIEEIRSPLALATGWNTSLALIGSDQASRIRKGSPELPWYEPPDGQAIITDAALEHAEDSMWLPGGLDVAYARITDAGLERLGRLTKLRSLDLSHTLITDAGMEHLQELTALQSLNLSHTLVTDIGLRYLKRLAALGSLDLDYTRVAGPGLEHLQKMTELGSLDLSHTQITDTGMGHLERLTNLRKLELRHTQITDAGLEHLEGLRELETLCLDHTRVTDAGLENLRRLANLRVLVLSGSQITDAGLEHLQGMHKLRQLYLCNTQVGGAGLEHLGGLSEFDTLYLDHTQVTDTELQHLRKLTGLKTLSLFDTEVGDAGLEHLQGLSALTSLNLGHTQVTGRGLEYLKGLTKLESLQLYHTQVSDAGLEHLQSMVELKELALDHTRVTDAGLRHLKGLKTLNILGLTETQVTDEAIKELKKALPACCILGLD